MVFVLPPKSQVGVLDAEIAGEGRKVHVTSEGDLIAYDIDPVTPVFPDISKIKSIRHYFAKKPYRPWPAWLYHPTEDPRLVKTAEEAAELGVCYRDATIDERGRYGVSHVWDWAEGSEWRAKPHHPRKYDPRKGEEGKNFVPTPRDPREAQDALIGDLLPKVIAAVIEANSGRQAPAGIDPKQYDEFLKFQAWQKSEEAVASLDNDEVDNALSEAQAQVDDVKSQLEKLAAEKGIKIKKNWDIERIKQELDKAA